MAKGQEVASWEMKSTSVTFHPGPAGSVGPKKNP